MPNECRACTFLAGKAEGTVQQAVDEPLESDRHFTKLPIELCRDPIDHLAAHQRLPHGRVPAPIRPVLKKIKNRSRKVMVGRHQPSFARDNSVSIMICIAGKSDLEPILEPDQSLHGIRRRRIHPNLAIPVPRHEAKGRIDFIVNDC